MDSSKLYISLYDALVEDYEFLQADDEHRWILSETVIIGALGTVVDAFASGLFSQLGERVSDAIASKLKGRSRRAVEKRDRDALLEALDILLPYLHLFVRFTDDERDAITESIAQTLHAQGFPIPVAREVAGGLVARMLDAGRESGDAA